MAENDRLNARTAEAKSRVPGWGADLDPKDRPAVPKERAPRGGGSGAHWDRPEQQVPRIKVFVSTEHRGLTPVFGTSCPPKGLSGLIRSYAYTYSEGQKAHWVWLLFADRVDVVESAIGSLLRGQPDNPFKQMGLKSELKPGAFRSRFGENRNDVRRMRNEALIATGLGGAFLAGRALLRRRKAG